MVWWMKGLAMATSSTKLHKEPLQGRFMGFRNHAPQASVAVRPPLGWILRVVLPVHGLSALPSHSCARRDQFSLNRRWLRSWLSMGTDLPVRILRQMPLATCTPAGRQEV